MSRVTGRPRRRHGVVAPIAAGALVVGVLCLLAGAGSAAAADEPDPIDYNVMVTVAPPAVPAAAGPPAVTTPRTTTVTSVDGAAVVIGDLNPPVPGDDEYSLGGILYVSGLSTVYAPSVDPLAGTVRAQFTVLNVSTATIDSSVRFWVTNPFGGQISEVDPVPVSGLKPNESRVIEATLNGVGQWTFSTAHFTLTPPATVDGVPLEPLTRDAFVFLPPWFLLGLGAIACAAYVVVRIVRYSRLPVIDDAALAGAPA